MTWAFSIVPPFKVGRDPGGAERMTGDAVDANTDSYRSPFHHSETLIATMFVAMTNVGSIGLVDCTHNNGTLNMSTIANVSVTGVSTPPSVAIAAAASPNPVTGTTTALSVLGADTAVESTLKYTWTTTGTPPAPVTLSANGTNASKNVTATFTKAGAYSFQATITDANNLSVTSSVNVTVSQTVTTLSLIPVQPNVWLNSTTQFTASGTDQFGNALTASPVWSLSRNFGSVSSTGLYTAPAVVGSTTVMATFGNYRIETSVFVIIPVPTIVTAATANPNPGTGTTTALFVLGADIGGEASLTYTWSTTGKPPAPVTFSANGTNAAKNTTATFTQPGSYSFLVTISNTNSQSTTSAVVVTVNQTPTIVVVSPSSVTINASATQQFYIYVNDQVGFNINSPTTTWSVSSGRCTRRASRL